MITLDMMTRQVAGLHPEDLQRWIELAWVRPEGQPGRWVFRDIDVARVRLIVTLQMELQITEDALPTVLSLLDQLYDTRRQLRQLADAVEAAPQDVRHVIMDAAQPRSG